MMKAFKPLIRKTNPFKTEPDVNKPSRFRPNPPRATVTWLKPELVCEVSYTAITSDGVMRHPSFEGMREDKKATDVRSENVIATETAIEKGVSVFHKHKMITPLKKASRKTLLNLTDETQVRSINKHELKFTNLSKIFWPKEKITKRDIINYYYQVAPYMLPYMKDRPQSLNRHPNGINGESFYQKDVTGKVPDWINTFPYHSEADDRDKNFMVCTDEASLLYIASLGCIEMNPWSSRIHSPDNPDWCIIDLDPDKHNFDKVVEAALATKDVLDSAGIPSYPKTSGSTGMHVYIPLGAKYTYEESKEFARIIVKLVHAQIPSFTSIERVVKQRRGKLYLDFLQNRPQATLAAPYSVRPKPGATVSAPLLWEEVKPGLQMKDFNIHNIMERLQSVGDLFKPVLGKGINMNTALKKLNALSA
jgi:bifunctional non-homologous end joining protein LigD